MRSCSSDVASRPFQTTIKLSGRMRGAFDAKTRAILRFLSQDSIVKRKIHDMHQNLIDQDIGRRLEVLRSGEPAKPLAICVDCKEAFDADTSHRGDCRYHDGLLEPDYDDDTWADHDERCHGPIDTAENREMYLEAFKWECCDEPGDAEGCQRGAHRASESVEKSGGPVEDYESTEEEDDDEEDEEEEVEARNKKDEDPEVVIVGERQVVNKRKADDSFEVSVYAQKAKRGW
ncbi:hypothetical protein CFRS1_v001323 [Colletotrichum fructicola]|nr:hypothetical protein CFRS1_v001323 [Colletotrichum fructicola]